MQSNELLMRQILAMARDDRRAFARRLALSMALEPPQTTYLGRQYQPALQPKHKRT